MVTDKITGNQSIFDELSALHAHFEKQSLLGLTFFDVIKKARWIMIAHLKEKKLFVESIPKKMTGSINAIYTVDIFHVLIMLI